jgi:hypothetical protein
MPTQEEKKKIAIAVVCLVLAAVAVAWNFGLFEPKATTPSAPPTPEGQEPRGGGARSVNPGK